MLDAEDQLLPAQDNLKTAYQIQHDLGINSPAGTYYYQVKTITGMGSSEKMSAFTETKLKVVDQMPTTGEAPAPIEDNPAINYAPLIPPPGVGADGAIGVSDLTGDPDDTIDNEDAPEDDLTPGVIKLTVNQPAVGGVPVKGANSYRVDVSDDMGKTWTNVHAATKPINEIEYEHKGLKPEEALHFRLFAKRGSETGLASAPVLDYAGNTDMPSKVRTLEATKQDPGSIKLSWVAPEDDGGAKVEQYCIVVNELDENDDFVIEPCNDAD